ncbi:MAG TPA: hypothetical protein VFK34_01335 [Marmoricola sp.]|jgi:hypothetical protein|nr:hypothetical protein [Marmoricola sp.]
MTDDEIPPLLPPHQMPPVTDQASLHRTWRALMGKLGFASRQIWILFLEPDGQPIHAATVEQVPRAASPADVLEMTKMFASVDPQAALAFLYARPGGGPRTEEDLAWGRTLAVAARDAGVGRWPVHLANGDEVTVVAPDDLAEAS